MFILLNGSFGIGKTTTARALTAELAASSTYDPERLGIVLGTAVNKWALRRAEECCRAHRSPAFGHPVDASVSTPEIVRQCLLLVGGQSSP